MMSEVSAIKWLLILYGPLWIGLLMFIAMKLAVIAAEVKRGREQ